MKKSVLLWLRDKVDPSTQKLTTTFVAWSMSLHPEFDIVSSDTDSDGQRASFLVVS